MRISQKSEIKQMLIFDNLLSANVGRKNQQNNVSTHMRQQPHGWDCHKKYYLFKIFLRQNAIAKCKTKIKNFMSFQLSHPATTNQQASQKAEQKFTTKPVIKYDGLDVHNYPKTKTKIQKCLLFQVLWPATTNQQ